MSGDDFEFLIDCGYSKPLRDYVLDDKKEMLECVILHFTHYRIRAEVDQLKEGLAKVGVLPAIQSRPNLWKPLLCHTESLKVIPDYIRRLFEPVFSAMGSNARRAEEDSSYHWEEYLKEMGKNVSPLFWSQLVGFTKGKITMMMMLVMEPSNNFLNLKISNGKSAGELRNIYR